MHNYTKLVNNRCSQTTSLFKYSYFIFIHNIVLNRLFTFLLSLTRMAAKIIITVKKTPTCHFVTHAHWEISDIRTFAINFHLYILYILR